MSLIKGKRQENTILDFSDPKTSKNKIKESLKSLDIIYACCYKNNLTIFDNYIKVGNYNVKLILNDRYDCRPKKLREFGRFQIRLFEQNKEININKDYRFKKQQWIKNNQNNQLKIKDLIDTIIYCGKLNKLKIFL